MDEQTKPHIAGVNHIALEVGSIDEALAFYARNSIGDRPRFFAAKVASVDDRFS